MTHFSPVGACKTKIWHVHGEENGGWQTPFTPISFFRKMLGTIVSRPYIVIAQWVAHKVLFSLFARIHFHCAYIDMQRRTSWRQFLLNTSQGLFNPDRQSLDHNCSGSFSYVKAISIDTRLGHGCWQATGRLLSHLRATGKQLTEACGALESVSVSEQHRPVAGKAIKKSAKREVLKIWLINPRDQWTPGLGFRRHWF